MEWLAILAVVLICPLMHFWLTRGHEEKKGEAQPPKHKNKRGCCH